MTGTQEQPQIFILGASVPSGSRLRVLPRPPTFGGFPDSVVASPSSGKATGASPSTPLSRLVTIRNYGHSTQLIGIDGRYVLTDPHFGKRCVLWPRRSPLPDPSQLPKLDAVCISHAHSDHLHISSFKYIPNTVPVIVPEGMAGALRHSIQNPIIELHWWTRFTLPSGLTITAVPALHTGGVWIPWRYRTVCGFLVSKHNATVYFAGDTRTGTHFKEIGNTVKIDVALLPIAGITPMLWYKYFHLTPRQAVEAAVDLHPQVTIPIHWGTFGWSKAPNTKELETFKGTALLHHLETQTTIVPPGETWHKENT